MPDGTRSYDKDLPDTNYLGNIVHYPINLDDAKAEMTRWAQQHVEHADGGWPLCDSAFSESAAERSRSGWGFYPYKLVNVDFAPSEAKGLATSPLVSPHPSGGSPQESAKTSTTSTLRCTSVNKFVKVEFKSFSGPGHCDGEVHAWIANHYNEDVECVVFYRTAKGFDPGRTASAAPGAKMDIGYDCNALNAPVKYACFPKSERADSLGNSCTATVHAPVPSQR